MNSLRRWAAILIWSAAQLGSGGSITGTVRLPGCGNAAGVRVAAMVAPGVRLPANEASVLERITQTDSNGRYQLDDLPAGRYLIFAGPLSSPMFYPGTLAQAAASIVTITRDERMLIGIDISLNEIMQTTGGDRMFSGQLLTEDGSPLPGVPMKVVSPGGNSILPAGEGGSFRLPVRNGTTAQFAVQGLPPGYFLKSVVSGGRNGGPGPVLIDGKCPATLVLTLGFQPVSTLQRVTARGKVMNIARELNFTSLSLTSIMPSGPTALALIQPDRSFEFSSIPVGAYRAGVRSAAGNESVSLTVTVIRDNATDLTIDFRNNPFPEFESSGPTRSPFIDGKKTEITGVVTQKLTRIAPPDVEYFRMDVKDERTGDVTPWAVYVAHDFWVPNIAIGETISVMGTASTDGTTRLSAEPF